MRNQNIARGAAGLVTFLSPGEAVPRLGLINADYFPPSSRIAGALGDELGDGAFWSALGDTLTGWMIGLGIAAGAAVLCGLLITVVPFLRQATASTIEFLRPIPSVALIPLAVLLYGSELRSVLLLVVYASFWQVLIQVLYGVQDVDPVATFAWDGYIAHIARSRPVPAFDDKAMAQPEPGYFGDETHVSRHFTTFGLRYATGDRTATVDRDIPHKVKLANPMTYLEERNPRRARHWWLRIGTSDTTHSLTAITNLALKTQNLGDDVNLKMYWDGGHGANEDPGDLIKWMGGITGYSIG